jgi:crotonobetainyl-CoA:carnitine CoA-transferase CaiB-like acyl-CoA transferase
LMALFHRDARGGEGQVIDLAIIEPIMSLLGPAPTWYDQLGVVPKRTGNRTVNTAPRNIYKTRDGQWVAVSASTVSVAERVMELVGRPEYRREEWFKNSFERYRHADELDSAVQDWIGERDLTEVLKSFEEAEAAISPIYDVSDVMKDPQYRALHTIVSVPDEDLGMLKMQNVIYRMMGTPGKVRWGGRRLGQDNSGVFGELGVTPDQMAELKDRGVI